MKTFFLVCLYLFLTVLVVGIAGRLLRRTETGKGVCLGKRDQILKMASLTSLDRTVVRFVTFRLSDGSELDLKTSERLNRTLEEGTEYDLTWKGMILKTAFPVCGETPVSSENGADAQSGSLHDGRPA